MFHRIIKLPRSEHFFLFGPRGTGKSTLLTSAFPRRSTHLIDLLLPKEEDRFSRDPGSLVSELSALPTAIKAVIIDEVQKAPKLLDVVHHLIETGKRRFRFILTGSSARKLKRGHANLLAGRAFTRHLFPLTLSELGDAFEVQSALSWGTLPKIFSLACAEDRMDFLQSYTLTYLKEEVQAEQAVRRLDPFRRFLEVAAQSDGKIVNFSNIAKDTGTDPKTVKAYYEVLEDTLLGFFLESFHTSRRKRLRVAPKFFFFDLGVSRALSRQLLMLPAPATSYYGELFERLVILEIYRREAYLNREYRLTFLETRDGAEIDLVVERPGKPLMLIEIKSTDQIRVGMLSGFMTLAKDFPDAKLYCLSRDPVAKRFGRIQALPWEVGVREL